MTARPTNLKKWASQLSPPSKELRAAYRAAWTDQQCAAWGERTSAKLVLRQATNWLMPAAAALKRGAQTGYSLRRVAFLAELTVQLEDLVLGVTEPLDRGPLDAVMERAKKARTRLLQRAALMVGGDERRAAALAELAGTPRNAAAMVKFLVGAAKLVQRWRRDPLGAVLADDIGLDREAIAELEDLAVEVDRAGEPFAGLRQWEGDAPATNVLEGRVLRELRAMQLAFSDARESRQNVPPLRVLSGLKAQLAPQSRPSKKKPKK